MARGTDSSTPIDVVGVSGPVDDLAGGAFHTCGIVAGGAVKCWGYNLYGQLGDNSTTTSGTAVDVVGLPAPATALTAGAYHTCAVLSTGAATCWGRSHLGQLGAGTTVDSSVPVPVSGLSSGVTSISAYENHTCAVESAGAECWGENDRGQLGNGTTDVSSVPISVAGLGAGVSEVASGGKHSCAVAAGGVKCWGRNANGELGNNSTDDSTTPVATVGLSGITTISAGAAHTCAIRQDNTAACWGYAGEGQLGNNSTAPTLTPVKVDGI